MVVRQRYYLIEDAYQGTFSVEDDSLAASGEFALIAWGLTEEEARDVIARREAIHGSGYLA